MSSARNVAARAVHRVRSPARLNAVVELNKALKAYRKSHERLQELENTLNFYRTPGVYQRRNVRPMSNTNASFWRQNQRLHAHLHTMNRLGNELNSQIRRFERAFPHIRNGQQRLGNIPVNQLGNFVNRIKKVTASHVIARRVESASLDPRTELGRRRLRREFSAMRN